MLFFIFAAIVLPSTLGCCIPDTLKGRTFRPETGVASTFLHDLRVKKYISRPLGGNVKFILTDFALGKAYTKSKDGSCKTTDVSALKAAYAQCAPSSAKIVTGNYFGKKDALKTIITDYKIGIVRVVSSTTEQCVPIIVNVRLDTGLSLTDFYTNVTTGVQDVSDVNQDISNCVQVVG